MLRKLRDVALGMAMLCLLISQCGCLLAAAAGATGATVAYAKGDLETTLDSGPQAVADATERAMKSLDVAVVSKQAGGIDGQVIGRTARDVKLTVTIKSISTQKSKISIRAGVFGNDAIQANLLDRIREEIGAPATAPTPP